jgi:hypothetical protein
MGDILMLNKFITLILLLAATTGLAVEKAEFKPYKHYCDTHNCKNLPANTAPTTVIVVHGMDSSLDTVSDLGHNTGVYIRMASFLEDLGKNQANYHVYGIDYNAASTLAGAQPVRLMELNHKSTTCNNTHNWENCWNVLEKGNNFYTPLNITVRDVSRDIREILIKAARDGYIAKNQPVTIIAHSMGGLVVRDLLYNGDESHPAQTGYEQLMNEGIWINEYVSLASPHNHGFFAIDNKKLKNIADFFACKAVVDAIDAFKIHDVRMYQYCMLENWGGDLSHRAVTWDDDQKISISKLDFPQIRWVLVAATGERLLTDHSVGDGLVEYRSALYHTIYDEDKRSDQELIINEYADSGNFDKHNDLNANLTSIPGRKGMSFEQTYSGFPAYSNANHVNINNVGFYYGNKVDECAYMPLSPKNYAGAIGCVGYFQYVIPSTTLCKLPGFNANTEYYRRNPQFGPNATEIDLTCKVH